VAEAANGAEALAVCRQVQPDLVLLDVRMPDTDGLTVTRSLRQQLPQITVLLFSMLEEVAVLAEWRTAGAAGFLLKGAGRREVLAAMDQALHSRTRRRTRDSAPVKRHRSISRCEHTPCG
jgi:two-component system NarL family response regulator